MLSSFFASKEENVTDLSYARIIETRYNSLPCTKITLKTGTTAQYEILKSSTHPNIISILKLSNHSIYINKVTPLPLCLEKDKKLYYKCLIFKLKDALSYIHETFKREHRAILLESIFISSSGEPILGNFSKSTIFIDSNTDFEKLNLLSLELTGENMDNEDEFDKETLDFVLKLSNQHIATLKTEGKVSLMNKIIEFKEEIPMISVKNVFKVFLHDLENESSKDYKLFIIESLRILNKEYFYESKKALFSIIDSTVRMCLLKMFNADKNKAPMDDIVSDLCLGLRVKEKTIKNETIKFIFNNTFSTDSMSYFLENMLICTDSDSIALICTNLMKIDANQFNRQIYKLLYSFLLLGKSIASVYLCLDKFCFSFDKIKISKEILPNLCGKLIEKENQEQCFSLVEKIIKFLKEHKEEVHNKEWSLKNISSIFNKKEEHKEQKERFEKRISKFSKEETNEWEGTELL